MRSNRFLRTAFILWILVLAGTSLLSASTLAKYTATSTVVASARVAKWDPSAHYTVSDTVIIFRDNSNADASSTYWAQYDNSRTEVATRFYMRPQIDRYAYALWNYGAAVGVPTLSDREALQPKEAVDHGGAPYNPTWQIVGTIWRRDYPIYDPAFTVRNATYPDGVVWQQDFSTGASLADWFPPLHPSVTPPGNACYAMSDGGGGWWNPTAFGNSFAFTPGSLVFENPVTSGCYAIEFTYILADYATPTQLFGFIPFFQSANDYVALLFKNDMTVNDGIQLWRYNSAGGVNVMTAPRPGPIANPKLTAQYVRVEVNGHSITVFINGMEVFATAGLTLDGGNDYAAGTNYIGFMTTDTWANIDNIKIYGLTENRGNEWLSARAAGYHRKVTKYDWYAEQID